MLWNWAIRLTALLLLFTAASCLLATDPFFPQSCQEDSSNPGSGASDLGCFCCCNHVMPVTPFVPPVVYTEVLAVHDPPILTVSADRPLIYHPPRV